MTAAVNPQMTAPRVEQVTTSVIQVRRPSALRRGLRVLVDLSIRIAVLLVAGLIWELCAHLSSTPFFPPLSQILARGWSAWFATPEALADFWTMASASLGRLFPGMLAGIAAGVIFGVLLAKVRWVEELLFPLFQFLRAIPSSAKIPLFIAILGLTDTSKIWVIALAVALPLVMNVSDGVKGVDPTLRSMARAYRVGRMQELVGITIPSALPQIFAGLRIGTTIAIIVLVLSELTGAFTGIGQFIQYASSQFRPLDMWAGVLLLGALGYLLNAVLSGMEHVVLRWQREANATSH